MSTTKKISIRIIVAIFSVLLIGLLGIFFIVHEPLPKGQSGPEADALATQMLEAVNAEAWDSTFYLRWVYRGSNVYVWDRKRHLVRVEYKDHLVLFHLNDWNKSIALKKGEPLVDHKKEQAIQKAWNYFLNDSYWLIAPFKIMDEGVTRSVVHQENKPPALLVTFTQGGATPGDSYLWELGADYVPVNFKMWVSNIPVGGLKATWENWIETPTGAKLATLHRVSSLSLEIQQLQTGRSLQDIGFSKDPFSQIDG